jgi:polysaccharide biosynthesis/export protein
LLTHHLRSSRRGRAGSWEPRAGRLPRLLIVLAGLATLAACGLKRSAPGLDGVPQEVPAPAEYIIGIPDLLRVTVWEQEGMSGTVLVRSDGRITVPLAGALPAAGLTTTELAQAIELALAGYVNSPRVDVAVEEMRSHVVSVIGGGVNRSGVVELRHDMRVVDALAAAGGLTPFAKAREIRILRSQAGEERAYGFDFRAFSDGLAPASNFRLAPGDTIVVPD